MKPPVPAPYPIVPSVRALPGATTDLRRLRDGFRAPHDSRAMSARREPTLDGSSELPAAHVG